MAAPYTTNLVRIARDTRAGREIKKREYRDVVNILIDQGWRYVPGTGMGTPGKLIPPNPDKPMCYVHSTPSAASAFMVWLNQLRNSGARLDENGKSTDRRKRSRTVTPSPSPVTMTAVETDIQHVSTLGAWWRPAEPEPEPEPTPEPVKVRRYQVAPHRPVVQKIDPDAEGTVYTLGQARTMIRQGYHVNKVIARTGWGMNKLSDLVDQTGYYSPPS